MTLWHRMRKAAQAAAAIIAHPKGSPNWFRFLLPGTKIDYEAEAGDGLGSNVFMAPVLWIARAWMEAKLVVATEGEDGDEFDPRHPLVKLLRHPNPFYSGLAMTIATLLSWFLDGNVYWLKARNAAGQLVQLWYVPHWMMEPIAEGADFLTYYRYTPGGTTIKLPPSEVVHIKFGLDPRNVRKGFSIWKPLLREIFSDDQAANFVAALLRNRGVPGVIISPKDSESANPEDLKETKLYVQDNFGGDNAGAPLVLGAPTEVKEFGYDPAKLDVSGTRNMAEERVCAEIGLPAAVVGFGSGMEQTAVGATLMELHRIAWVDCVIPNQDMIADEIWRGLKDDFGGTDEQRLTYDRKSVRALADDLNKQAERLERLVRAAIMKRKDAKKELGLEVEPGDDVYLIPLGVTEVGPGAPLVVEPEPAMDPDKDPAEDPAKDPAAKSAKRLTQAQARIARAMDQIKKVAGGRLELRLRTFLGAIGAAAAAAYRNSAKSDQDELHVEAVMSSINFPARKQELRGIMGSHFVAVHKETVSVLAGMGIGVDLPDAVQLEILAAGGTRAGLVNLSQGVTDRALAVIRAGREEGQGVEEIARQLREVVPAGKFGTAAQRARTIARTETREAQTQSALRCYRSAEGIDQVMIIDGRLGDTDEDCQAMNGQTMSFDDARAALSAEHPNGTRDIVPVFTTRGDN